MSRQKPTFGTFISASIGAGIGSSIRHMIYTDWPASTSPWIAFGMTMLGCVVVGMFLGVTRNKPAIPLALRQMVAGLLIGVLTAFPDFVFATERFLNSDHWLAMALYVGLSVILGFLVIGLGYRIVNAPPRSSSE